MDLFRETTFGRIVRLATRGKLIAYDESLNIPAIPKILSLHPQPSASSLSCLHSDTSDEASSTNKKQEPPIPDDPEKGNEYVLVEWTPNDSHNPRNWSSLKKIFVTFQICFLTTSIYIGSAIYTAGLPSIQAEFDISAVEALLGLTLFVIGYALGPMVWAPMSEIPYIGRNPVYIGTLFAFVLLQLPVIYASNTSMLFAFRFITGLVGSPVLATGGATIADMYEPKKQAYGIGVWGIAAVVGPAMGPLVGGFAAEAHGWTWTIWELLWLSGFCFVVLFFFLPETSSSNILYRRTVRLRALTKNPMLKCQPEVEAEGMSGKEIGMMVFIRPFTLSFTEPICFLLNLYLALIYGLLYLWFESFPIVFIEIYYFSLGTQGLAFLGILIGSVVIMVPFFFYNYKVVEPQFNPKGQLRPEVRLQPAMVGAFFIPVCLFWFGWSARASVHWIMPIIGSAFFGMGAFLLFMAVLGYLGDAYPAYIASVFAGNDLMRSSFGAAFPLFANAMYRQLGIGWASSLLGFLSVVFVPIPFLLYLWGGAVRRRSRMASHEFLQLDSAFSNKAVGAARNDEGPLPYQPTGSIALSITLTETYLGLRYDHGDLHKPFDPPAGSTSRLSSPCKTESFCSFGANGTLGWTTAAGELLQVASCIDNKLIGAEYKKGIQGGMDYQDRGKMLEKAIRAPQGSGCGIGLSLKDPVELVEKSWVHNRWPRFTYRHGALDIRLQYYVDASTVIQEYQVRNTGQEEVRMPYIYSSDICFREHGPVENQIYPVPTGNSPARLLLFQNSQLLVRNKENHCQISMALFLNAQRQSLWAPGGDIEEDVKNTQYLGSSLHSTEGPLDTSEIDDLSNGNDAILRVFVDADNLMDGNYDYIKKKYQQYHDHRQGIRHSPEAIDFASYGSSLLVPPGSTQELRAVIQLSALSESKWSVPHSPPVPEGNDYKEDRERSGNNQVESNKERLRSQQRTLVDMSKQLSLKDRSQGARQRISRFIANHLEVGKACSTLNLVGEARFHLCTAYLIARFRYEEDSYELIRARFVYSNFLYDHGWFVTALEVMEPLSHTLSDHKLKAKGFAISSEKVRNRLATMYLKMDRFSEAETMYGHLLLDSNDDQTIPEPLSAHYIERQAWARVTQQKFETAHKNYSLLLKLPENQRGIILSNLGFIEWKLGNFQKAKSFFEESLRLGDTSISSVEQLYARSAWYACLNKLVIRPEDDPQIACSLMRHVDFVSPFFRSSSARIPTNDDGPFQFAMERHLETLLSSCSVPVENNEGTAGIAFLDADPLDSAHKGDSSYFQFEFLAQCRTYINTRQPENAAYWETSERIRHACRSHLVWIFKIAELPLHDTWAVSYPVGGSWMGSEILSDERTQSRALQGAFHFSKLWLYLNTWSQDWEFTVELLHGRLEGWLSYLRATQHMGNLWVEQSGYENLKPYDTISADQYMYDQQNPEYHLSDFTMLWLAVKRLEKLIDMIEESCRLNRMPEDDPVKLKVNKVRELFDSHQNILGIDRIRFNILKTFTDLQSGDLTFHTNTHQKTVNSTKENDAIEAQSPIRVDNSERSTYAEDSVAEGMIAFRDVYTSKPARQVIAFSRSVSEFCYQVQYSDIATVEAASAGFFDESKDHTRSAWQEALKMQLDNHIADYDDPRLIALTLYAAKLKYSLSSTPAEKIHQVCRDRLAVALYDSGSFAQTVLANSPEPTRFWNADTYQTLSVLIGGLFEECRYTMATKEVQQHDGPVSALRLPQKSRPGGLSPHQGNSILMPPQVGTSPRFARKNVVPDTFFQPNWMYFPHIYLHRLPLQINCQVALDEVRFFPGFKNAIANWKTSKRFSTDRNIRRNFPPHVADSGTKKGAVFNGKPLERRMDIQWYGTAADFYDRLTSPRTFDSAKKRLVECTSFHQDLPLICWLTSPREQKMQWLDFLRRHGSSENFFGERVDWKGNIWETELHLGFYQLISKEDNKTYPPPHVDYQGQFRIMEMPSLSQLSPAYELTPVTMSLRFVGDLRDQAWTCHFLSSAARDGGFLGLVDEYTDGDSEATESDFHQEKMAQRKILEMAYVHRMLIEIAQSCEGILESFQKELKIPEARDPESESYEFTHNYSRLHSKTGEILRDILKLLNLSLRTVENWEKREDSRDTRSRWSQKDETRFGPKLVDLARKCKIGIQQVRAQKDLLEEQQKLAEQRHNNLVNYMSLQAARTSSQSAEDVRLFTYVTIFFVPLSFSSSLFSMGGAPERSTLSVMVPTTMIALALTIFALANMKVLDRNLSFRTYNMNALARKKMRDSKAPWGIPWNKISMELEEAAELRLAKPENEKHLTAQSRWWYIVFWISYAVESIRTYMLDGFQLSHTNSLVRFLLSMGLFPACALIFIVQTMTLLAADLPGLVWQVMRWLKGKMISDSHPRAEEVHEKDVSDEEEKPREVRRKSASIKSVDKPARSSSTLEILSEWLQTPPRPLQKVVSMLKPSPNALNNAEHQISGSDAKADPWIQSDGMRSGEDEWIEKYLVAKGETSPPEAQPEILMDRRTLDGYFKEKPSWWTRVKNRKAPESRV
ncbi:MAG: hypothetical protein Q9216_002044 [Gyalolechia sp. 2 TL-2023]